MRSHVKRGKTMSSRIKAKHLIPKVMDPNDVVKKIIPRTGNIAFAGMAGTALPKEIPKALHRYISETNEKFSLKIFHGGSATPNFDEWIAPAIAMRIVFGASDKKLREALNKRKFDVIDIGLYENSRWLRYGIYGRSVGKIDVAILEASLINEDGYLVPSLSVDAAPAFVEASEKIIIELNLRRPELTGLHDIYLPSVGRPIPISNVLDKVGTPYIKVPESKIAAIILSEEEDAVPIYSAATKNDLRIAENILDFISHEFKRDPNLKSEYTMLQPGAGPMSSAIAKVISEFPMSLGIWAEAISTTWIPPILEDKIRCASSSVLYTLPGESEYRDRLYSEIQNVKERVVLRPYEITNNPGLISRFYTISVQQAIEVDIYGHVNVSHIGSNLYGGVGGSIDFTRLAYITIVAMPSTTSNMKISRIVPIAQHVDIPEHDVDILVTEQGWVDLRGLPPVERAKKIIDVCSHPKFKDALWKYLERADKKGGHEPVDQAAALKFWEEIEHRLN